MHIIYSIDNVYGLSKRRFSDCSIHSFHHTFLSYNMYINEYAWPLSLVYPIETKTPQMLILEAKRLILQIVMLLLLHSLSLTHCLSMFLLISMNLNLKDFRNETKRNFKWLFPFYENSLVASFRSFFCSCFI